VCKKVAAGSERGWIVPIGGAEEKENSPQILRRFVSCAGAGRRYRVFHGESRGSTAPRYESIFNEMGVRRVAALDFDTRRDAEEPADRAAESGLRGLFTGGNQLRLSTSSRTSSPKIVRQMNAAGCPLRYQRRRVSVRAT